MEATLPNDWQPRGYQLPLWSYLEGGGKRAVACWHRRSGKDDVALHWAAVAGHERPANYWHLLPLQRQARRAVWDAVNPVTGRRRIDEAFPKEVRETTLENEMLIRFKSGSTWQVLGSDGFDALVGAPPAGIVFSEWALADPRSWSYLRPILDENDGWAVFLYTPRGRNHGLTTLKLGQSSEDWFAEVLTAHDTSVFAPDRLARIKHELVVENGQADGEALFAQEYECSFQAAIVGSYYGGLMEAAEKEGRISGVPYDPSVPVITGWDLGVGDSTVIWFLQQVGKEIHWIDYYEASGVGLDHYAKVLREKPYAYGDHLLPHDARARELGTGRTRVETLASLGIKVRVIPQNAVDDGINALRLLLPRSWFDKAKCERGIEALRSYRREWDEAMATFRPRPLHDWSSHAADAARTFAMGLDERPKYRGPRPTHCNSVFGNRFARP